MEPTPSLMKWILSPLQHPIESSVALARGNEQSSNVDSQSELPGRHSQVKNHCKRSHQGALMTNVHLDSSAACICALSGSSLSRFLCNCAQATGPSRDTCPSWVRWVRSHWVPWLSAQAGPCVSLYSFWLSTFFLLHSCPSIFQQGPWFALTMCVAKSQISRTETPVNLRPNLDCEHQICLTNLKPNWFHQFWLWSLHLSSQLRRSVTPLPS